MTKLTIEEQYIIYSHYIGDFVVPFNTNSPLREDNNASFGIFEKNGSLIYNDFVAGGGDVYNFIRDIEHCSFPESLKIAKDILKGVSNIKKVKVVQKPPVDYKVETGPYKDFEYPYWDKRDVSEKQLLSEKIYPLRGLFYNGVNILESTPEHPTYVFDLLDNFHAWKTYRPGVKKFKWLSQNTNLVPFCGKNKIKSDVLWIESSRKDRIVVKNCCRRFNHINPISEGNFSGVIQSIKDKDLDYRFKFSIFDFDKRLPGDLKSVKRGVELSKKLEKNSDGQVKALFLPKEYEKEFKAKGIKDFDEVYIEYGKDFCRELVNKFVDESKVYIKSSTT